MPEELIHTPPETTVLAATVDEMIQEVAGLIGGETDPAIEEKALRYLDRATSRLNSYGLYMFRRTQETYDSFTAGQETLTLPSTWGWPENPATVYDADGKLLNEMEWITWEKFEGLQKDPLDDSVCSYITIRSEQDSLAYIYPAIDTEQVGSIKLTHVQRLQKPSNTQGDDIILTEEMKEAVITGAQFLLMKELFKDKPNIWVPWQRDFKDAAAAARRVAWRMESATALSVVPDETGRRTVLSPYTGVGRATVILKL